MLCAPTVAGSVGASSFTCPCPPEPHDVAGKGSQGRRGFGSDKAQSEFRRCLRRSRFACERETGLSQPALKVRGREYLRIIYGPEYTEPQNLDRLRQRGLGAKRSRRSRVRKGYPDRSTVPRNPCSRSFPVIKLVEPLLRRGQELRVGVRLGAGPGGE
jgi:hypothetical protein